MSDFIDDIRAAREPFFEASTKDNNAKRLYAVRFARACQRAKTRVLKPYDYNENHLQLYKGFLGYLDNNYNAARGEFFHDNGAAFGIDEFDGDIFISARGGDGATNEDEANYYYARAEEQDQISGLSDKEFKIKGVFDIKFFCKGNEGVEITEEMRYAAAEFAQEVTGGVDYDQKRKEAEDSAAYLRRKGDVFARIAKKNPNQLCDETLSFYVGVGDIWPVRAVGFDENKKLANISDKVSFTPKKLSNYYRAGALRSPKDICRVMKHTEEQMNEKYGKE
jgi:hypothetical protein